MSYYDSLEDHAKSVLSNANTLKCDIVITYQMNINHY